MAPGRKRGAKGVKTMSDLSIGDLVLAKVKGFPAWPAKISRPEEWKKPPDPKKYFVQFFGTGEIAFVAPADIQMFTSETKNKLSARCHAKGQFAQAVKDICAEFDELQQKKSCPSGNDTNNEALVGDSIKVEQTDRTKSGEPDQEMDSESLGDGSGLERCSKIKTEKDNQNCKPLGLDSANVSPTILSKKGSKFFNSTNSVNELTLASGQGCHSVGEESPRNKNIRDKLTSGDQSVHPGSGRKQLTNGQKAKLKKRKLEGGEELQNVTNLAGDTSAELILVGLSSDENKKKQSSDLKSGLQTNGKKKAKQLRRERRLVGMSDSENETEEDNKLESCSGKSKVEPGRIQKTSQRNEGVQPFKKSKCADGAAKVVQASRNIDNRSSGVDAKGSKPVGKVENRIMVKVQGDGVGSNVLGEEDVPPPSKRSRRALDAMPNSPILQQPTKRRAVRLCDDDDNEEPKTPVHGGSVKKDSNLSHISDSLKKSDAPSIPAQQGLRALGRGQSISLKELKPSIKPNEDTSQKIPEKRTRMVTTANICSPGKSEPEKVPLRDSKPNEDTSQKMLEKRTRMVTTANICSPGKSVAEKVPLRDSKPNEDTSQKISEKRTRMVTTANICSPGKPEPEKVPSRDNKPILGSPRRSPVVGTVARPVSEPQKPNKQSDKVLDDLTQGKVVASTSVPAPVTASDNMKSSLDQPSSERGMADSSGERKKTTPKSTCWINDHAIAAGHPKETVSSERVEAGRDDRPLSLSDLKVSDPDMSMKHLIAAAQAKRRQAHLQNAHGILHPVLSTYADIQGGSPNPGPPAYPFGHGKTLHSDASPSSEVRQFLSIDPPECEEQEERRVSSEHLTTGGGSLSGGTEAAVARDAFEGMIETLSRTKESIGRATRLAIDCAKYGIANEVVELLVHKLETEFSHHRRVDLFFLVDSITQCSHSHKGVASASYIPAVQEALSRLLGAAAPQGARENRRQCLKVLRLWLERKILPESLLRRHIDEIGTGNDDITAGGHSFRRPSRAERALDDPIREMEDMLVDEYGSNATFQLPGFLSSNVFEEEEEDEEILNNPPLDVTEASPVDGTPVTLTGDNTEQCTVTPKDRRSRILEDVDGELEMEDVSGHQKDESPLSTDIPYGSASNQPGSERVLEAAPNSPFELSSPPLPAGSPPGTPPLPSSPPPPPPPSSSPLPPPPPPSLPPPPPSQPHPFPSMPAGPPHSLFTQPTLPSQPSMPLQHLQSVPSSSPMVGYQQPLAPHEAGSMPNGHRIPQMSVNAPRGPPPQPQPHFVPVGVCNSREPSGYNSRPLDYSHSDAYINLPPPQSSQQFQPTNAPFSQMPMHPNPPPQIPSSNFSYPMPAVQQQSQHPYPPPYVLPNRPDGQRRYAGDEQWRVQSNEFSGDQQRGVWMGGRSSAGPTFPQEGYLRPHDRPAMNNVGFQPPANALPTGGPISGHGMPCRPDVTALNWRPA